MAYVSEFGAKMFMIAGFSRILRMFHMNYFIKQYEKYKYKQIIKLLDKKYGKEVEAIISESHTHCRICENDPIWIFWWQGENSMRPIVKSCYESVLKNASNHPVILITKENIHNYMDIQSYINDKIGNKITLTHFSDILREHLLYVYGGIWMDATIYMTAPFPKEMYEYEYYSIKGAFEEWDWTGFFQASGKGNLLAKSANHLFDCYWKEHDSLITYLLIDCFLEVSRRHSKEIEEMVACLPEKNDDLFLLNDIYLDRPYNDIDMVDLKKKSNLHKLSYKKEHKTKTKRGEETFYAWLINNSWKERGKIQ